MKLWVVCHADFELSNPDFYIVSTEKEAYKKAADLILGCNICDEDYEKKIVKAYNSGKYKAALNLWLEYQDEDANEECIYLKAAEYESSS